MCSQCSGDYEYDDSEDHYALNPDSDPREDRDEDAEGNDSEGSER